ncbi:Uncharacterised protein [Mycobacteroides abscessus]|nr:Uncharacterised protein [Mycobacteroides abscessus]
MDLAERMKRTVDSRPVAPVLASGCRYTSCTVAPLLNSLASDRVKPSSARWAMRSSVVAALSGVVPMTSRRPDLPTLRSSGVKNSCRALSSTGVVMPVASNTKAPNLSAQRPPRLLDTTS